MENSNADKHVLGYIHVRDRYEELASLVSVILRGALKGLQIHTIQARAKSIQSFEKKSLKKNDDGTYKYIDPLSEITDLAGVRVITYVPQTVERVEEVIRREFKITERLDKDAVLLDSGRIGYKSIHFLVQLSDTRAGLAEYELFGELMAEIQVRTILQHAWAEMEHDIQYKSDSSIPNELKRRFIALAGLLEIADREFESIQKEDERLHKEIKAELVKNLASIEDVGSPGEEIVQGSDSLGGRGLEFILKRYDRLIEREPQQYANYLGRAKAKFLAGQRKEALEDVEKAAQLAPGNAQVDRVRQQIEEGRVENATYKIQIGELVNTANRLLSQGNVEKARELYSTALDIGQKQVFGAINLAMCALLERDSRRFNEVLGSFEPHEGSFVDINVRILRLFERVLSGVSTEDFRDELFRIRGLIQSIGTYDLSMSPILYLSDPLQKVATPEQQRQIAEVMNLLWSRNWTEGGGVN